MATLDDTAAPVADKSVESSASAVEWAAIFGGGLVALGGVAAAAASAPGGTPRFRPRPLIKPAKLLLPFPSQPHSPLIIGAFVASAAGALGGFHRYEA
jgi:hypothetical protein